MPANIIALSSDITHHFTKQPQSSLRLIAGLGIEGDAHAGITVQHLSRIAKDPRALNLRQVHLIHAELLDELAAQGFTIRPGEMGENITTRGIDLLGLSKGTRLRLGGSAEIEVTGLRNPCSQLNSLAPGLMEAVLERSANGDLVRKCGVMAVVLLSGEVSAGDGVVIMGVPDLFEALGVV